jgi:hypothetical protein
MSGIGKISKKRKAENDAREQRQNSGMELWLKDGDVAFVSLVATGNPDDPRLDDFWTHTEQINRDDGSRGWKTHFCDRLTHEDPNLLCSWCDERERASHQFGIWGYVHFVEHSTRRTGGDDWEKLEKQSGDIVYREIVKNFRIFSRGFGMRDYLWSQLVDIYNTEEALDKTVVRIRRMGAKQDDTTYAFTLTKRPTDLSDDLKEKAKELKKVKEFFKERYTYTVVGSDDDDEEKPKTSEEKSKTSEEKPKEEPKKGTDDDIADMFSSDLAEEKSSEKEPAKEEETKDDSSDGVW